MRGRSVAAGLLGLALAGACRGTPPARGQSPDFARLVDSLRPVVEAATGLAFKGPIRSDLRTRDQVRSYLLAKLEQDFPKARQDGIEAVYRLLGMVPDTLDL